MILLQIPLRHHPSTKFTTPKTKHPQSLVAECPLDPSVPLRERFLNNTRVLVEIRNNQSGRYMKPLFDAVEGAVKIDEEEVVIPSQTSLRLIGRQWEKVDLIGSKVWIPYISLEEE